MRKIIIATLAFSLAGAIAVPAYCEDSGAIRIAITDKGFEPAEIHVPAGKPFTLTVKNETSVAAEFESRDLRVEKVIAAGAEAKLNVRAPKPGKHIFFNEFNEAVKGTVVAD